MLQDVPAEERRDAMKFYNDYFDDAGKENEIRIYEEIPETKQEIDNFIQLFDSEEYIARTDIFFLKENHIYFIVPWDESGRHYIHVELSLDGFSKLQ